MPRPRHVALALVPLVAACVGDLFLGHPIADTHGASGGASDDGVSGGVADDGVSGSASDDGVSGGGPDDGASGGESSAEATDSGGEPVGNGCTASFVASIAGAPVAVERVCKFEVPVSYVRGTHPGSSQRVDISLEEPLGEYSLSPKRTASTVEGNTISFVADEPGYWVLEVPGRERLFVFLDPPEVDAPVVGAPGVLNVMDVAGMDNTGSSEVTAVVQTAIDDASGATQNTLYFPAGTYATQTLFLRSDMTMYLAEGAILQNITPAERLRNHEEGLSVIEGSSLGYLVMNGVNNVKILGRGTIDGNGVALQAHSAKMFSVKIENSENCVMDGVLSRDSAFWNTLVYRSRDITVRNYKVINNRLEGAWNETDGVDFDNSSSSRLENAFIYAGDDCMAVKSDDIPDDSSISGLADPSTGPYMDVDDIVHERVVCVSSSAGCKIGTKTFGEGIRGVTFRDVDIVASGRALVIEAVDTANVTGTVFEDIRIEHVNDRVIDFNLDADTIFWRPWAGTASITNTHVTNVSSDVVAQSRLLGRSASEGDYFVEDVSITNLSIAGAVIASLEDPNANVEVGVNVLGVTFAP